MNIFNNLKLKNNLRLKQIISLLSINVIGIPLGLISSILITRYLGAKDFGDYMFVYNIISIAIILGTFGFFQAGNRAIILSKNKNQIKEYFGAQLIIALGIFLFIYCILLVYVNFDFNISDKGLKSIFFWLLPFTWVYILVKYFEVLFQADNEIKLLGKTRLYPKIIFTSLIAIIYIFYEDFSYSKLVLVYYCFLLSQIIVFLYVIFKLEISFKNFKLRIYEIWELNKSFGINVYIGSVFSLGFAELSTVLISYYGIDNSGVGFYALAITIAAPLSFIPNTIATTHYKDFSNADKVSKKALHLTLGITLLALLFSWLLISPFIRIFYGIEFEEVINLFYIVSIGVTLYGLADFYNRFLGANGQGNMLRNSSFLVGLSLLFFSLALIPFWGEVGAAWTKALTGMVYLLCIIYQYNKFKLTKNKKDV